ncbi:hypothetical protein B0J13DRAFT_324730 [Dactylonectria estremocensis]|uniref:Uncharacterized protein n=1 Tax=Dactylonectria estremocensis TaxID=1079267 RepID=A0A9P9EV32_9HYPO|nr:hypothetical protein B0J13DRAFT_324730 [Dactylonectria estremocensis]
MMLPCSITSNADEASTRVSSAPGHGSRQPLHRQEQHERPHGSERGACKRRSNKTSQPLQHQRRVKRVRRGFHTKCQFHKKPAQIRIGPPGRGCRYVCDGFTSPVQTRARRSGRGNLWKESVSAIAVIATLGQASYGVRVEHRTSSPCPLIYASANDDVKPDWTQMGHKISHKARTRHQLQHPGNLCRSRTRKILCRCVQVDRPSAARGCIPPLQASHGPHQLHANWRSLRRN